MYLCIRSPQPERRLYDWDVAVTVHRNAGLHLRHAAHSFSLRLPLSSLLFPLSFTLSSSGSRSVLQIFSFLISFLNTYGNNGGGTINPNHMNQTGSLGRNPSLDEDYHQQQPDDSRDLRHIREWRGFNSSRQKEEDDSIRWRVYINCYENLRENQKIRRTVREREMNFFCRSRKKWKDSQRVM